MEENYVRFGSEWEKELMKSPKKYIIELYRNVCIEKLGLRSISQPPNKNGWYLAFNGDEWDRCLYKNGRWFSQLKEKQGGNGHCPNVMNRVELTKFITRYQELPSKPDA